MIPEYLPPNHLPPKEFSPVKNEVRTEQAKKLYLQMMDDVENFPALFRKQNAGNLTTKEKFENQQKLERTLLNPHNALQRKEQLRAEEPALEGRLIEKLRTTPYLAKIQKFFLETMVSLLEAFGINEFSQNSLGADLHKDYSKVLREDNLRSSVLQPPPQTALQKKTKKNSTENLKIRVL